MQRHTAALLLCHNPLLDVCLSYRSCSVSLLDNWHYDFEYKIICCNFTGLSSVKSRSPGRVGLWAFCYYATTSVMAVFTGIVVVVLIKPGKTLGSPSAPPSGEKETMPTVDAFLDLIRYPSKKDQRLDRIVALSLNDRVLCCFRFAGTRFPQIWWRLVLNRWDSWSLFLFVFVF